MSPNDIPVYFEPIKNKIIQVDNIARDLGINKTKLIIDYAKSLGVNKIVVGVNCLKQLEEIVGEYNSEITDIDFKCFSLNSELIDPRFWVG